MKEMEKYIWTIIIKGLQVSTNEKQNTICKNKQEQE